MNPLLKVYIIVINWNSWKDTISCLEQVQKLAYGNYRTVVVDNGSDDDSWLHLQAWARGDAVSTTHAEPYSTQREKALRVIEYDQVSAERGGSESTEQMLAQIPSQEGLVYIRTSQNLGFTGGGNLGIAYAIARKADFVFLLNNDARIAPDAMGHLITAAVQVDAAIVGARVMDESGRRTLFSGSRWPGLLFGLGAISPDLNNTFWPSAYATGSAILLRRDLLEQRFSECSYFLDPLFFLYCEETDLCLYGQSRGYRCVIARDAVIYHDLAGSSGGAGNPRSYYYLTRNRIHLANRWLKQPWKALFHLFYIPSRLFLQLIKIRRSRKGAARAVARGLRDGYHGIAGKWISHGGNHV